MWVKFHVDSDSGDSNACTKAGIYIKIEWILSYVRERERASLTGLAIKKNKKWELAERYCMNGIRACVLCQPPMIKFGI